MGTMCLIHPAPLWPLLCVCVSDIERERSWWVKRERKTRPFVWPFTALPNQCHTSTTSAQSFAGRLPNTGLQSSALSLYRGNHWCAGLSTPSLALFGMVPLVHISPFDVLFFSSGCWTDLYRGDTLCGWKVEQQDPVAGNTSLNHFEMSLRCAALS